MKRRLLGLAIAGAFVGSSFGCAPRLQKTYLQRYAEADQKRREEAALEEGMVAAPAAAAATPAPAAAAAPAATRKPPPPPPPDDYSSLSDPTPPIGTATRSRVIQPSDDEEAIY